MTPEPGCKPESPEKQSSWAISRISGSKSYSILLIVINVPEKDNNIKLEQMSVVSVEEC